jgi:iron complex outermembrane receptor protein
VKLQTIRGRLLASTMIGGAVVAIAVPALAQQATPDAPAAVKEVVVTGSRIARPNTTAVSPVQTVGQAEFKLEGTVNAESLLNNLPSVAPSAGQYSNNGASGIATVDLRGFGAQRTLVLIDGRRMPPGDPTQPVADLNLIPSSLVESVDVMTGGAASVYGSDAIAGVVNFKMKHNFQGLQIDAQYDFGEHDNNSAVADRLNKAAGYNAPTGDTIQGRTEHLTITFGSNSADGKGNLEGYLGYINSAPVRQSSYDYANCAIGNTGHNINGKYFATGHACSGSSNSAYGKFIGNFYGSQAGNQFVPGSVQSTSPITLSNNPGGSGFVPYDSAPPGAASRTWNYAPDQYFQRQDTRYQGGYFAHYDVNEHITAYSDFMFEDDHSIGQLAPSGLFWGNGAINQISCNNPLASQSQLQALCGPATYNSSGAQTGGVGSNTLSNPLAIGYRFANEPRDYVLNHDSFKLDEGFKGNINDTWSYDVYAQFGKSTSSDTTIGDVSKARIANALDAVTVNGKAVCASAAAQAAGCVPLNIFQPLSAGITPQQFNYLEEDASITGYTTEQVVSGNVVGKLGNYGIKSPFASEGVGIALGAEYRRDYIDLSPDAATTSGDLSGASVSGTQKTEGSTSDKDLYGELNIPLVQDHFLIKDLSLDTSYRWSEYNLAGNSGTYKFGGDWVVNHDIRFRGSFARTERAPNVLELFTPQSIQNGAFNDPCAGAVTNGKTAAGYTEAQCYATAKNLTQAQFSQLFGNIGDCPAGQCDVKQGGNENLKPEIADSTTFGFVATPSFLRGFYASVDYWDVHLMNAIQSSPASAILNGCLNNASSSLCNLISRDPVSGSFVGSQGYVTTQDQNIGGIHKRGYDFQADYKFHLKDIGLPDWGSINQEFSGTYLVADVTEIPGEAAYNCAGLFGLTCSAGNSYGGGNVPDPRWRHKYRVTWATPWKVDVSLQWRYIAAVKADVDSSNQVLAGAYGTLVDAKIPAYNYFDLAASWQVKDNITLRMGVNNIFDKDPPVIDSVSYPLTAAGGNTYPGMYDPLGRTLFVNLTAKY